MAEVGRPRAIDENTLPILEGAFADGATDKEACFIANIGESTLYKYQTENPEFIERKAMLKDMTKYQARKNVREAIISNDKDMSKWFLERRDKEYKPKSDLTTDDKPLQIYGGASVQKYNSDQEDIQSNEEN
jgi:hypothetical protein